MAEGAVEAVEEAVVEAVAVQAEAAPRSKRVGLLSVSMATDPRCPAP